MKIRIRYVVKKNRTTDYDYYDVGQYWGFSFPSKKKLCKIVWNKWFFNRRIVVIIFKLIKSK